MKIYDILTRFYIQDIEKAIPFYENLLKEKCSLRFSYQEVGLELAQIGNVLLLSGSDEALKPFIDTKSTFMVDSIDEWRSYLLDNGAVVVRDKKKVPTGYNMTLRHPDGTIIEYVQHTKQD
ncbi:hypothetical protein [Clostridioides difficile]|uniref:VOC family protein n=1 Tax=Clostridioides difficile TaxID=1496 RepID=UPI002890703D|nr:VOC family protein [Clostridioides difficile]MDV9592553.1 VOC family protein [Clostridioides difficile]MDW0089424.1 VOC family protein [Clostridioides difficile]HDX7085185.1 VOC family protein [Clostridioides difficile]